MQIRQVGNLRWGDGIHGWTASCMHVGEFCPGKFCPGKSRSSAAVIAPRLRHSCRAPQQPNLELLQILLHLFGRHPLAVVQQLSRPSSIVNISTDHVSDMPIDARPDRHASWAPRGSLSDSTMARGRSAADHRLSAVVISSAIPCARGSCTEHAIGDLVSKLKPDVLQLTRDNNCRQKF